MSQNLYFFKVENLHKLQSYTCANVAWFGTAFEVSIMIITARLQGRSMCVVVVVIGCLNGICWGFLPNNSLQYFFFIAHVGVVVDGGVGATEHSRLFTSLATSAEPL